MIVSLDYDDTYTKDKELWNLFIRKCKASGYHVEFVTLRSENGNNLDITLDAAEMDISITFCNGRQKAEMFEADIWIDDMPEVIPTAQTLKNCWMSESILTENLKHGKENGKKHGDET